MIYNTTGILKKSGRRTYCSYLRSARTGSKVTAARISHALITPCNLPLSSFVYHPPLSTTPIKYALFLSLTSYHMQYLHEAHLCHYVRAIVLIDRRSLEQAFAQLSAGRYLTHSSQVTQTKRSLGRQSVPFP